MIADDTLLLEHAQGTLPHALEVLLSTHVELNPDARAKVQVLHAALGHGLQHTAPTELSAGALDAVLARLDQPPPAPVSAPDVDLPRALWPYAHGVRWQTMVPGRVHQLPLPVWWGDTQVAVVRMRPGFRVPTHTHHGAEFNLVLEGGFTDMGEELRTGQLCTRGPEHEHDVQIHDDGPCIVLVVRQGALIPRSPMAHLASWFTGF